jgi:proline iminopeptidase
MLSLYPSIQPYNSFFLKANGHDIYVEEVGNPHGVPILFIHGGPGSGISADSRRLFDPQFYRIILFDQRGCGQSTPHQSLYHNTTQDLIDDIENIRLKLKINSWVLYGGSWGTTLALLYAQQYPEYVKYLILRGVFLARAKDIAWLFDDFGAARLFPEHYAEFRADIPASNLAQLINYYWHKFNSTDELERIKFAKKWATWETKCSTLKPSAEKEKFLHHANQCLSFAIMEVHYFMNNCFIEENEILNNMHKLHNIPGIIIHGRQDIVCPVDNAYELFKAWPAHNAQLQIIVPAGHSVVEPLIANAIIQATNFVKNYLA